MPNNSGFLEVIELLRNGELVRAGTANRAPSQIDQNVRYLRDLFEAAALGETVYARARTVEVDAQVGQPVFYNGQTLRYERALSQINIDEATGTFTHAPSAQVWGVIVTKHNSTKADILLNGVADIDLSQSVVGTPATGLYYLSSSVAGRLVQQRPPAGVTVLQVAGAAEGGKYTCYVNTKFHDILESHRHFKFTLACVPAGDYTDSLSGSQEIDSPNDAIEGWLPADHASFGGKAPAGAVYGYNIKESKLASVWPPQPVEGCYLEWNRGEAFDRMGMGVPLGEDQLCVIDRNGIWWMSDCYDDAPWPNDYVSVSPVEDDSIAECPRTLSSVMTLWFTKPVFSNTGTWVSSLRAADGSGLTITCVDNGEAETVGHLLIDFDLALVVASDTTTGHLAIKEINNEGKLLRGPIVESLSVTGSGVEVSSNVTPIDGKNYGNISLNIELDLVSRDLPVESIRLLGAEEEHFEDTFGIGFPAGRDAAIRGLIRVAAGAALPAATTLKLRFWVLGRSSNAVPANIFSVSYRRIATPAVPTALPTSTAEVDLGDYPAANVTMGGANRYFVLDTDSFPIEAGEDVLFTLSRAGSTDGFNGDLQLLRQRGVFVPA